VIVKNRVSIFFIFLLNFCGLHADEPAKILVITDPPSISGASSFAIFIDSTTFVNVRGSLLKYRKSIENDGLPTYLIVANWKQPEQVRDVIRDLYGQKSLKLEGFVLVGAIPIVMLQNAQYLTSAFRIQEESRPNHETSVPTDRFYDDLDLLCESVSQDSANPLLFYYRLKPESPVKLQRELYSARIPLIPDSPQQYNILNQYFKKVARVKSAPLDRLDNILTVTGFNYISDSHAAVLDDAMTLREIFNLQQAPQSRLETIFHLTHPRPKQRLLRSLELPEGDLFILHSHGNEDSQFIQNNETNTLVADENVASQSVKPGADSKESTINMDEISQMKISPEVVLLDVCYNGAFHQPRFMAGAYLFSRGDVVTVMGNSVNVRQDIALVENLGALGAGARIGQWHQVENYLESHLFGDPTFRFALIPEMKTKTVPPFERFESAPEDLVEIFRKSENPYLRASALNAMFRFGTEDFNKNLELALKDPANIVRLKAWMLLASQRSDVFMKQVPDGLKDSYELIRRYSTIWMGEIGSTHYIQYLARAATTDPGERVVFNALIALKLIGSKDARTALKWILSELEPYDGGKFIQQVRANLFTVSQWLPNEVIPPLTIGNPEEKLKHIHLFRANRHLIALPILLFLFESDKNEDVRVAAAEALGWYAFYEKRNVILDAFSKALADTNLNPRLRTATQLSQRRLVDGPNNVPNP
jgi:hypothetical protein